MREKTTGVQIVMPQHCNGYAKPRLFGGQIMAWIDVVGAVAARRYTGKAVTTVCIDHLTFLKPAYLNDTIVQEAVVTWTGRTSLEVRVDSLVERLDGSRELINRAYLVFVAIDEEDKPSPVPAFVPETEEEKEEFAAAEARRLQRLAGK
ncbi:MAG: acyl-CoA thioesterase [Lachnospiraceae bacterium]|nr:acyl-CoA thioesterase [Lachnospiraceae bacterium]MBQ9562728.1 acyl-CoA thioesterase [Lachnospiraceae bacterium]MBR0154162.1 acyl-CoA thioesterase [Lachnospiraceae bacterium]